MPWSNCGISGWPVLLTPVPSEACSRLSGCQVARQPQTKVAWWGLALALAVSPGLGLKAGRSDCGGLLLSGFEEPEPATPSSLELDRRPPLQ